MTVIRTAVIKLFPTDEQKCFLDNNADVILNRASDILQVLLSMRGEPIHIRKNKIKDKTRNNVVVPYKFADYTPRENAEQIGKEAYAIIAKSGRSRGLRGPFVLPNFHGKSESGKLTKKLKDMFSDGVLPIESLGATKNITSQQDFAAFQIAHAGLKSWDDRNNVTAKNYQSQVELVKGYKVDEKIYQHLDNWLAKHKLFLTRKVVAKFKKFGWTTRLKNYHLEELQAIEPDNEIWLEAFYLNTEKQKLRRMFPGSLFTFPDKETSSRAIPFGNNYQKFALSLENNVLFLTIGGQLIECYHTNYFKNLSIKENKSGIYDFTYERGNKSPLTESVTAVLKEITIYKKNGDYYMGLPLNVDEPIINQKAIDLLNYCTATDDKKNWNSDVWPSRVRVMGVDLGITAPASCFVAETTNVEKYNNIDSFVIGEVKSKKYCYKMKHCKTRIKETFDLIDNLREALKDLKPFSTEWLNRCEKVNLSIKDIQTEINQLRRYDLKELNVRNQGVSHEQIKFIQLYKLYIALLQKWTYFGTNPTTRDCSRKGFEKHYHRLNMLKEDFRKKVACQIVREARLRNVNVIVAEDLKEFKTDQEQKTSQNELLMIWGSGQIGRWITHFAEQYGILVYFICPKYTSQLDPLTDQFGSRQFDKGIKVERDGEIFCMDADKNAAENIVKKMLTRETSVPVVKAYCIDGGFVLGDKTKGDANIFRRHYISKIFGNNKFIVNGTPTKLDTEPKLGKEEDLFRYGDKWMPYSFHNEKKKERLREWWGIKKANVPVISLNLSTDNELSKKPRKSISRVKKVDNQ